MSHAVTLKILDTSTCRLSGTLPSQFSDLSTLDLAWLYSNKMSGTLPTDLSAMTTLWNFALSNNRFSGDLPGLAGGMVELYVRQNDFR